LILSSQGCFMKLPFILPVFSRFLSPLSLPSSNNVNVALLLAVTTLTACGGGGDDAPVDTTTPVVSVDITAPVITLNGESSLILSAGTAYSDLGATANDATDGNVTVTMSGAVNSDVVSSYTLTYSASDAAGNNSSVTRTVVVVDDIAPVITLEGDSDVTHSAGTDYTDAGATATDATDGSVDVVTSGEVDSATVGSYTLTYTVTDAAGNIATTTRTVKVVDDIAPVLTLNGVTPFSHNAGDVYADMSVSVTDNIDEASAITITATGEVNADVIGSYTVTYTAQDTAGNEAVAVVRTVNVADLTAPVITLTGEAEITHNYGDVYNDAGATALDGIDGVVEATTSDIVLINKIGSYGITYTATDAAGNEATLERIVNVVDLTAPVITLTGGNTITLGKGRVYKELGATALDNLDGETIVDAPTGTVDNDTIAKYQLTYTATDVAGNTSKLMRTVDVVAPRPFITTWKTDNNGVSDDLTIKIGTDTSTHSGDYNYTVDWGDGDITTETGDAIHPYAEAGTYTVTISGDFPQIFFDDAHLNTHDNDKLLSVEQWGDINWLSMYRAFSFCTLLVFNAADTPDLTKVRTMQNMFYGAVEFNSYVNDWDVSSVTNMAYLFSASKGVGKFNQELSAWDVSSVTDARGMFYNATNFNQNISAWNVSKVTDMYSMFAGAKAFNQDVSNWDVSSVTSMQYMFYEASEFNQNISTWPVTLVDSMGDMFNGATLSTANYDALLIGWSERTVKSGVDFDGGNSLPSAASQDARTVLTEAPNNWTIKDASTP
jgi:surface protein